MLLFFNGMMILLILVRSLLSRHFFYDTHLEVTVSSVQQNITLAY
jgi:hypothetical protein